MKAITIWQPWASLIAMGHKTIETRTHDRFKSLVSQRIAIHAGRKYDARAYWTIIKGRPLFPRLWELLRENMERPQGCVVCTAFVAAARRLTEADSKAALCPADGLFGLVLTDIEPVDPPIKARGRQGIWEWDERSSL